MMGREQEAARPWIEMRGVYGWHPSEADDVTALADGGVNAVFMNSEAVTAEIAESLHARGIRVFAEFNTMHDADYVQEHPEAAPVGADGEVCPAPDGWQGACPTHVGYRRWRMERFAETLGACELEGMWLDYHHSHASWEQAEPNLPDTCFCERCLTRFSEDSGLALPDAPPPERAARLLGEEQEHWVRWRCHVFTDWVREFREIVDRIRPGALLGTFHCPWSETDRGGALRGKLAIDLRAQAAYLDVFSIMPYHARFGHVADIGWISRQIAWLGSYLGIEGRPDERHRIWPIVQLSDWGESVPPEQVGPVLEQATRPPATGVMVFAWGSFREQPEKVDALVRFYRALRP